MSLTRSIQCRYCQFESEYLSTACPFLSEYLNTHPDLRRERSALWMRMLLGGVVPVLLNGQQKYFDRIVKHRSTLRLEKYWHNFVLLYQYTENCNTFG